MHLKIYIKMGWENILYILKHKWYYFLEAMKNELFVSAFTHDLSKFCPIEYIGYIIKFCMPKYCPHLIRPHHFKKWKKAYNHHIKYNKHHWNHWLDSDGYALPMPIKYIEEMICDWQAMGKVFGDDAITYYKEQRNNIILHPETRKNTEMILAIYYNDGEDI